MNLRILKKLSKRAAPLLPLLGDHREQFLSEAGDNYHGLIIHARKHWERCSSVHDERLHGDGEIVLRPRCRAGTRFPYIKLHQPYHPWPGTAMIGSMEGYYEPEWSEESAWGALDQFVRFHFCDWDENGPAPTRKLRNPSDVFRAADEMIAARDASLARTAKPERIVA
ncbi:hypothetical protein [Sphingomonas sp.]|uniref:hypothetical protein n=1 Tax=Sphingomonas sp. TaxID=28214 RepID=UPI003AFFAE91